MNEFPDLENIGIDIQSEFIGAKTCVLCHYACETVNSRVNFAAPRWLPEGNTMCFVKNMIKITLEMDSLTQKT